MHVLVRRKYLWKYACSHDLDPSAHLGIGEDQRLLQGILIVDVFMFRTSVESFFAVILG